MPDAHAVVEQDQRDEVMPEAGSKPRVLVVEDEALVAMLIEDILIDAGFEIVGPFGQAEKAIAALEQHAVDAAILDVNLGGGARSYGVAGELVERGLPFIFVTGYGQIGIDTRFRDVPVLQKPFAPSRLQALIRQILAVRSS
jgi:two-component SAPR family response regulator